MTYFDKIRAGAPTFNPQEYHILEVDGKVVAHCLHWSKLVRYAKENHLAGTVTLNSKVIWHHIDGFETLLPHGKKSKDPDRWTDEIGRVHIPPKHREKK